MVLIGNIEPAALEFPFYKIYVIWVLLIGDGVIM